MNYHPDDFLALTAHIEGEGGFVQADACEGTTFRIKLPAAGGQDKMIWKRLTTTHCGMHARVGIAYDPTQPVKMELPVYDKRGKPTGDTITIDHPGEEPAQATNFVLACAVDDAIGLWPRYAALVSDQSYQT